MNDNNNVILANINNNTSANKEGAIMTTLTLGNTIYADIKINMMEVKDVISSFKRRNSLGGEIAFRVATQSVASGIGRRLTRGISNHRDMITTRRHIVASLNEVINDMHIEVEDVASLIESCETFIEDASTCRTADYMLRFRDNEVGRGLTFSQMVASYICSEISSMFGFGYVSRDVADAFDEQRSNAHFNVCSHSLHRASNGKLCFA